MADFQGPTGLTFNRGLIADPSAFARDANAASWLFLCGEEFAAMEGGMSYADVEAAVATSANIVSDPPRTLDMDLARRHVAALDELPRPTLVTCRTGPRSSAAVYLYAGLKAGATADEVLSQGRSRQRALLRLRGSQGVGDARSRGAFLRGGRRGERPAVAAILCVTHGSSGWRPQLRRPRRILENHNDFIARQHGA